MKINSIIYAPVLLLFFLLGACSQKVAFQRSSVVPAAEAKVKMKKDRNGNYELNVDVENLARPENLTPSKDTYVVWMRSTNGNTYNLGELKVGDNLSGKLTAVTPYEPTRVFITAESDASGRYPGDQVVLEAEEF